MASPKRTITIRKDHAWVVEAIDKIVETKKSLGFNTSFSYELMRLAKNALVGSLEGESLDKRILKHVSR